MLLLPVALLLACGEKGPDLYDVSGATGAVLGIIEDGELACVVGVGRKVPGEDTRVGAGTLFRIGSCEVQKDGAVASSSSTRAELVRAPRERPPSRSG